MIPVPGNPDPDLLRRARRGEHAACAELHARYAAAIRALAEARRPGAGEELDAWCARFFVYALTHLGALHEVHWLHRDLVRGARDWFDREGLRADAPRAEAPDALGSLPIEVREVLLFSLRAEACSPFPGHEYFGITQAAYEARLERALRQCDPADREMTAGPGEDAFARQWSAIEAALPPERGARGRSLLPRLPLPLAFLLVIGVSMLGLSVVFLGEAPREQEPFVASLLATGTTVEPLPRVQFALTEGTELWRASWTGFELRRGRVEVVHEGWERPELMSGGRTAVLGRGRFVLEHDGERTRLVARDGSALLRWTDANGTAHEQRVRAGEEHW